eukprot:9557030-Alexandrium_andersonii.AAC.1
MYAPRPVDVISASSGTSLGLIHALAATRLPPSQKHLLKVQHCGRPVPCEGPLRELRDLNCTLIFKTSGLLLGGGKRARSKGFSVDPLKCPRCGEEAPCLHNGACVECAEASVARGSSSASTSAAPGTEAPDVAATEAFLRKLDREEQAVLATEALAEIDAELEAQLAGEEGEEENGVDDSADSEAAALRALEA